MPRIKKKGQAGAAKNYVTRNQAIRKLQISLPDFRKLCIWKGIYPREPRSRKKVSKSSTNSTTFYYAKDIQFLLHEPLLGKFREQKVLEKKISRALGRGDVSDAARLDRNAARPERTGKPRYTLDHVVRERYPTFVDALRDLDDCLSMVFLFANLPSTTAVPAKMIARCERLCLEFQHYLIASRSLRKSFLSIKGIYYQANIQGEDILWLVPYKFNQRIVGDVDFRIMGTFIEFYMTLLGFVNFRLYTGIGLKYPPKFDEKKDDSSGELGALTIEGGNRGIENAGSDDSAAKQITENGEHGPDPEVQAAVNKVIEGLKEGESNQEDQPTDLVRVADDDEQPTDALDKFEPAAFGGDILPQPAYGSDDSSNLFSKCTFFLSRETPRQPLEFILRAFGCKKIGWDAVLGEGAYTTNELDPTITHQIVDRPVVQARAADEEEGEDNQTAQKLGPNQRVPGRIYVQPQWVWDSVNDEEMKRPDLYAPGAQLPPHFSPFVKSVQGQYDPTIPLEEQEPEEEKLLDEEAEGDEYAVKAIEAGEGMDVADDEEGDESEFGGFSDDEEEPVAGGDDDVEEDEGEGEGDDLKRQEDLEAELSGRSIQRKKLDPRTKARNEARSALEKRKKEEAEHVERAKGMMSNKSRKRYIKMEYSNSQKRQADENLRAKRRKIEKQAGVGAKK